MESEYWCFVLYQAISYTVIINSLGHPHLIEHTFLSRIFELSFLKACVYHCAPVISLLKFQFYRSYDSLTECWFFRWHQAICFWDWMYNLSFVPSNVYCSALIQLCLVISRAYRSTIIINLLRHSDLKEKFICESLVNQVCALTVNS